MMDQSEVALEIEDPLAVGHGHPSEVDPSHVAQCHKDIFALGISHVRLHDFAISELFEQHKARAYLKSHHESVRRVDVQHMEMLQSNTNA